ncbi:MAG: Uma2 family endonuclease [Candidatus Tectimicrobiota bacterium]
MATAATTSQMESRLPLLEAGGHLDQRTFHERYLAMPPTFRAELIGGVVFVPSPLSWGHGSHHALSITWLVQYTLSTPGTQVGDTTTTILSESSELQPDGVLIITPEAGGRTRLSDEGYTTGPPEFILEIASSSASIDLHAKRRDYEQAGVLEYVVVVLRQRAIRWFVWQSGAYQEQSPDADGIFRSQVFPGLWLHADALLQLNGTTVMEVLQQGIATPAHAAFVQQLQRR